MRLAANVLRAPTEPKVRHYYGMPPELGVGRDSRIPRFEKGACPAPAELLVLVRSRQFCYSLYFRLCSQSKPAMPNA
jgi:hypothetical protein